MHWPAPAALCVDAALPRLAKSAQQCSAPEYAGLLYNHMDELKAQIPWKQDCKLKLNQLKLTYTAILLHSKWNRTSQLPIKKKVLSAQTRIPFPGKVRKRWKSRFLCVKDSRKHTTKNPSAHYNVSSLHSYRGKPGSITLGNCCSTSKLSFLLSFQILRLWHL